MTDLERIEQLMAHCEAVAKAWCEAMGRQDKMILSKINSYLRDGTYEAEMPTALIRAKEALLEALNDGGT